MTSNPRNASLVTEALASSPSPSVRPTPEEVMTVLDLQTKVEAYLLTAAKAWLALSTHVGYDRDRYLDAHHVRLEWWDEEGVAISYWPRLVSDPDYAEHTLIPMRDLLPDFADVFATLTALGGGQPARANIQ